MNLTLTNHAAPSDCPTAPLLLMALRRSADGYGMSFAQLLAISALAFLADQMD
ncbi:hypothetical protein [Botrimarina mediterranea]|uniref:hypothetical protein n=1 Tax=Botrimarina mediterranea TaxID=2528022 RepID=UPI0018D43D4A|nr:hypothetical protein [Botrimarina mediterranea]